MNIMLPDGQFNPDVDKYDALAFCIVYKLIDGVRFYSSRTTISVLNDVMNFAATVGQGKSIKILIQNGANDWNGGMCGAAAGGKIRLVDFFIEKGADDWDNGLLHALQHESNFHLVKLFITKGADLNYGLYSAAVYRAPMYINWLIENGADDWNSGLLGASLGGDVEIVKFFIEKGANNFKESIDIAIKHERTNVIEFFRETLDLIKFKDIQGPVKETCSVCYCEDSDREFIITECNHVFHRECIMLWVSDYTHVLCPICKKSFI